MQRAVNTGAWVAYLVIIIVCADVGRYWHDWKPKDSSDLAAWVQAIGSLLALLATFLLASRAERSRVRSEAAEQQAKFHYAAQLATNVHMFVARVVGQYEKRKAGASSEPFDVSAIEWQAHLLKEAMRPSEMPASALAALATSLRYVLILRHAAEQANLTGALDDHGFKRSTSGTRRALVTTAQLAGLREGDLTAVSEGASEDYVEEQARLRKFRADDRWHA
jgi:cytochrome b561